MATKELAVASRQRTVSHYFYTKGFLNKNIITAVFTHPTFLYLFPRLKIKLKGSHFDTTEVIGAESQGMLNSLIERDFQDAF
jgi:hypothetical protein